MKLPSYEIKMSKTVEIMTMKCARPLFIMIERQSVRKERKSMGKKTAKDYEEIAGQIIEKVGGRDNITNCYHCMTRLRFDLKDMSLADIDRIKELRVIGAQFVGEQLQIIIGKEINEVYEAVCRTGKLETKEAIDEQLDTTLVSREKGFFPKKILTNILDVLVACVSPCLPILIGSGLIKALLLIGVQAKIVTDASPTYVTLSFVADAAFYFLPIYVGFNGAKKFGANHILGAMMGAILIHPNFVALVNEGSGGSVFGIPIYASTYASTIVPAILCVWVMSYIERFISKHSPKPLRVILEPVLTMLIMTPISLCLVAPLGNMLSAGFSSGMMFLHDILGPFAVAIWAAIIPFVIMTGLHVGTFPYRIAAIETYGFENFMQPGAVISNFTQGAACLGVGFKSKNASVKSMAFTCAFSGIVPGISEPGMYGITLKYKTPMIASCIGAFCGGLYAGIMNTSAYVFTSANMFALSAYVSEDLSNLINMVIAIIIGMVVSFIMTLVLYKEENKMA